MKDCKYDISMTEQVEQTIRFCMYYEIDGKEYWCCEVKTDGVWQTDKVFGFSYRKNDKTWLIESERIPWLVSTLKDSDMIKLLDKYRQEGMDNGDGWVKESSL